jgi:hypothetical protein
MERWKKRRKNNGCRKSGTKEEEEMHKGKGAKGEGKMNRGQEKWSYRRRGAKRARRGAKQGKRGK